jgi:hypothetical protein
MLLLQHGTWNETERFPIEKRIADGTERAIDHPMSG